MKAVLGLAAMLLVSTIGLAADQDANQYDLWKKAYPKAEEGQTRHVLHLPKQDDEYSYKIELIAGKTIDTDGVNRQGFSGGIKEVSIEGWGYPRYNVTAGPVVSTLIGVPPGKPLVKQFVTVGGGPHLFRYNSKLPIVVYAPEGFEVRYRFWKADAEMKTIPAE